MHHTPYIMYAATSRRRPRRTFPHVLACPPAVDMECVTPSPSAATASPPLLVWYGFVGCCMYILYPHSYPFPYSYLYPCQVATALCLPVLQVAAGLATLLLMKKRIWHTQCAQTWAHVTSSQVWYGVNRAWYGVMWYVLCMVMRDGGDGW